MKLVSRILTVMNTFFRVARRWLFWASFGYFVGFVILWLGGGYVLTESGRVRTLMGVPTLIAAPDVAQWQPLLGHFQPSYQWPDHVVSPRCDFIGWAYFPLLSLVADRYSTVTLLDDRGAIIADPVFPRDYQLHPLRGGDLARVTR